MIKNTCSECVFAEDVGSQDTCYCTKKERYCKINEPGCTEFRSPGIKEDLEQGL